MQFNNSDSSRLADSIFSWSNNVLSQTHSAPTLTKPHRSSTNDADVDRPKNGGAEEVAAITAAEQSAKKTASNRCLSCKYMDACRAISVLPDPGSPVTVTQVALGSTRFFTIRFVSLVVLPMSNVPRDVVTGGAVGGNRGRLSTWIWSTLIHYKAPRLVLGEASRYFFGAPRSWFSVRRGQYNQTRSYTYINRLTNKCPTISYGLSTYVSESNNNHKTRVGKARCGSKTCNTQ